jgi:phosphoribosylaminoimidazole carboxylase PurE protein
MTSKESLVSVIMGSVSDADIVRGCTGILTEFDVPYDVKILSAHRTPDLTREYVLSLNDSKTEVIIAAAGWAAHLAGFIAGMTVLPVIGIPVDSSPLNGMDALLATVQMPPGIPVATVAVGSGGAKNAAILALQILALNRPVLKDQLLSYRRKLAEKIEAQNLAGIL